ncbi:glycosyltransferase family 2 protein [Psychroserpens luteus]|uniref:Glycosyltransferase family 2 protein n=1 Tax=Psychroserpens luteus TaxID=1434066 RepID=A0ABW5ZY37_9FLAO|nr:glycosyltransferase family 2 protein [Psychroserpens luteus]
MKVYVIIVTYNGAPWIDKCLGSLRNSTIPLNVLVIDNNSADNSRDLITQNFPEVELILSPENLGFGRANNIGLKRVKDDKANFAFLLNQDAWIEPNTIEILVNNANKDKTFGILSPVHLDGSGNSLDFNFSKYLSPEFTNDFLSDAYVNNLKAIYSSKFANAAAWLISLECVEKLGGFDPIFPHYGEDDDYLNRLFFVNFKLGIVPSAKICHDRINKPWAEMQFNLKRKVINNIGFLKNPKSSLRSNLLILLKQHFDVLTSDLLFFKFKKFKVDFIAILKTLLYLRRVKKARKRIYVELLDLNLNQN